MDNKPLDYFINQTMMRIDMPNPLKTGESFSFKIKWWYNINYQLMMVADQDMKLFQMMIIEHIYCSIFS